MKGQKDKLVATAMKSIKKKWFPPLQVILPIIPRIYEIILLKNQPKNHNANCQALQNNNCKNKETQKLICNNGKQQCTKIRHSHLGYGFVQWKQIQISQHFRICEPL